MLNNAWPSIIWHLYDYYLRPGGGYFGTKKACEPFHIQYSYDNNSVAVINSTYDTIKSVKVTAKIYNLDATEKGTKEQTLDLAPDSAATAFELPAPDGLSKTYFLRLQLHDQQENFSATISIGSPRKPMSSTGKISKTLSTLRKPNSATSPASPHYPKSNSTPPPPQNTRQPITPLTSP